MGHAAEVPPTPGLVLEAAVLDGREAACAARGGDRADRLRPLRIGERGAVVPGNAHGEEHDPDVRRLQRVRRGFEPRLAQGAGGIRGRAPRLPEGASVSLRRVRRGVPCHRLLNLDFRPGILVKFSKVKGISWQKA